MDEQKQRTIMRIMRYCNGDLKERFETTHHLETSPTIQSLINCYLFVNEREHLKINGKLYEFEF